MAYHGNLQKIRNGKRTFAITPHIPGGFIKPEGLIKIGEVAKKYGGGGHKNAAGFSFTIDEFDINKFLTTKTLK